MDKADLEIIDLLKHNSRITSSEIGKRIGLSIPAVSERIRKLEGSGAIAQYTIKMNRDKFNIKMLAFILVNIDITERIEDFRESIVKVDSVLECHHVAGEYDYLLKVAVRDAKELENFISGTLKRNSGVSKTNTIIALSTLKENINPSQPSAVEC